MSKESPQWINVDKAGLAKLLGRRGKEIAIFEPVQNAWDADGTTEVHVSCRFDGTYLTLRVQDNSPSGFLDIGHAYTMFAPSHKVHDPLKRGRFNLGEKLVLALSERAKIETTTGTVTFGAGGRRVQSKGTDVGTIATFVLKVSREEFKSVQSAVTRLIPPAGIKTLIDDGGTERELPKRNPVLVFPYKLTTEQANEAGVLRQVKRDTEVRLYQVAPGEVGWLYEMGIPIIPTGDHWDCEVCQKVPLTQDRDNVRPGFLSELRLAVFNSAYHLLDAEACNEPWVQEAAAAKHGCKPEAFKHYTDMRFGKALTFDPSDPEANNIAVSQGYTLVYGNMLSSDAWKNARAAQVLPPAGKVTPSPKPYSPDGPEMKLCANPTPEMFRVKSYAIALAQLLLGRSIHVVLAEDPGWWPDATYGPGQLVFNVGKLGRRWFDLTSAPESENRQRINELLLHEFAHEYADNHLDHSFHNTICKLGAKLVEAAVVGKVPQL